MKLSQLSTLLSLSPLASAAGFQKPLIPTVSSPKTSSEELPHKDGSAPSYRDDLVSLHKFLVETPSISYNESHVAHLLRDFLRMENFRAELQELPADSFASPDQPRYNVLAWPLEASTSSPPSSSSPKVVVSSHIDTVPPFIPYARSDENVTSETVISGRGSVDAKASVAAQIVAVQELLRADAVDPADLMLVFVVGEERKGDGMRHFSDSLAGEDPPVSDPSAIHAAVFGEPTEAKLACGHKGFFGCEITAKGKAGHSGYPWLGKSATEVLMRGLVAVLDADLGSSELFGNTTVNVGMIEGGVAANVIPESARANIAGRVAIGPEDGGANIVSGRLIEVLQSVDEDAFDVECNNGYGVVKTECDVDGFESITVNYGTDVPNFKGNHTRYLYGPGTIFVAHGPDEALKLKDLELAVEDYKKLIIHALKN